MRTKIETRLLVSMLLTFCLMVVPVSAFGKRGEKNFKAGVQYELNQQWEKAAQEFTLAIAADPSNVEYQLHFRRASFNASQAYMQQGRALAEQNDFVGAYNAFRLGYGYDPVNELAVSEMERMIRLQAVKEGHSGTAIGNGGKSETQDAGTPSTPTQETSLPTSGPQSMRIIAYTGDLKDFIRRFANELSLNVIFDRQSFVTPKNIDINLKDVTTSQALDYVFLQEGLFFQKLSRRTIVVADQARRPQYQQLVLRTFYLANSDPDKVKQLVSQAIPPSVGRPQTIVVSDKDTNSLTVRDTAENVRLIGELITSIDKDRAEVVMDVNIYEVSKSDLLQIGNQIGGGDTLSLGGFPGLAVLTANGTLDKLATGVNLAGIAAGAPQAAAAALVIPGSVLTAFQNKSNTKLVASTQVHAFNNEESTARIGQRVPVQTAQAFPYGVTQTGTSNPTQSNPFGTGGFPVINYEPTGLTLRFTPQVFPNHDVQVKMSIESKDVLGAGGLQPTFTERTITGTARVQNNRTMMLASVSQDVQTNGRRGLPVLGGLPLVGRLFASPTRDNRQIDIVIAVTPRVIRAPAVTPRDLEMRPSGTLQSPTTGSLEAMLREADQEDRLAAAQLQKANATAKASEPAASTSAPAVAAKNEQPSPAQSAPNSTATNNTSTNSAAAPSSSTVAAASSNAATTGDPGIFKTQPAPPQQTRPASSGEDELAAFVPAPKSLVTNQSATEVAAINANLTTGANAVLTSLPKPIETSVSAVSAPIKVSQIALVTGEEGLKVGEKRWLTVKLNSDTPLALGTIALRFDPKVVKITAVSAGTLLAKVNEGSEPGASVTQSINPMGICLVSISNLNGVASIKGEGVLLYVEVEALAPGDAGLVFEKGATHFVGVDARDVVVEASPIHAIVKQ